MFSPYFPKNNVPIVFATDLNYLPYLGVAIHSLLVNATVENNYDIFILAESIPSNDQNAIICLAEKKANAQIRFVDMTPILQKYNREDFYLGDRFTLVTYYRLFLPEIFINFSKVLYLDSDIVVIGDISELYQSPLSTCAIGAIRDIGMIRQIHTAKDLSYWTKKLQLKDPSYYFNAGVILFDLQKIRQFDFTDLFRDKLFQISEPNYHDMDILNSIFNTDVKLLDSSWNAAQNLQLIENLELQLPNAVYQEFVHSVSSPKLIHYCGPKPWEQPQLSCADYFWQYACQTEFYQEILTRNITEPRQDRWYRFGRLTPKRKLWVMAKVLSKKLKVYKLFLPFGKVVKKVLEKK